MLGSNPGAETLGYLQRQAERCARLAAALNDRRAREELERMAGEFESLIQRASPLRENAASQTSPRCGC